jgi:3-phosphoshikimate 1-carboxyvinyltransferase
MAPALIDEIPALAVLATQCTGLSEFKGIGELRIKESDRIRLIVDNLARMGATVREWEDGFAVQGPVALHGAEIECAGDHRIAMAFGVAGLLADGKTRVAGCECAGVSYPEFWHELQQHTAPGTIELHE